MTDNQKSDESKSESVGTTNNLLSKEHPARTIATRSYTINKEQFESETSVEERFSLKQELCTAILSFVDRDVPIFLEGLGVIYSTKKETLVQRSVGSEAVFRTESSRVLEFEKCDRLCEIYTTRFKNIVETKDLARRVHPQLPVKVNLKWSESDTRRFIRGFMRSIKEQLIQEGCSNLLDPICTLYCLIKDLSVDIHDAFAGADIFIKSSYRHLVHVGPSKVYEKPVLNNAWELLEAAYSAPIDRFQIDVAAELDTLDFNLSKSELSSLQLPSKLRIAVFLVADKSDRQVLLLSTDGLRSLALNSKENESDLVGTELTVQIDLPINSRKIPHWVFQCFALGVLVLCSSRTKKIKPGLMVETEQSLLKGKHCNFSGVLTTEFKPMPHLNKAKEIAFHYINLVGIEEHEVQIAKRHSPDRVVTLLEYKACDQVTDPNRRPLLRVNS